MWLNRLNRFERLSTVFNLGTEYDFLCVVCWDIRRSFYVCYPIVKIRKTKSGHLYLRSVHFKNWLLQGLHVNFTLAKWPMPTNWYPCFPHIVKQIFFCSRCYSIIVYPMIFRQDVLSWPEGGANGRFLPQNTTRWPRQISMVNNPGLKCRLLTVRLLRIFLIDKVYKTLWTINLNYFW